MFAQWGVAWSDALSLSFWKDILATTFSNVRKLVVVVLALLLISMGAVALSVPALMQQVMMFLDKIRLVGMIGHFLVSAGLESAMLVFVLQACAPKGNRNGFGHYLSRVFVFWLLTSVLFGFFGPYVPVMLVDVVRVAAQFALFAWVYDRKGFVDSFSVGFRMIVGSLPVLALLIGLSMAIFATQDSILAMSERVVTWWGVSFVIVTMYSVLRPALLIAMYHKHKKHYV
jgi:hypothetical protein